MVLAFSMPCYNPAKIHPQIDSLCQSVKNVNIFFTFVRVIFASSHKCSNFSAQPITTVEYYRKPISSKGYYGEMESPDTSPSRRASMRPLAFSKRAFRAKKERSLNVPEIGTKEGPTSVAQWEGWSEAEGLRRRAADARRHNDKKKRVTSKPSLTY